MATTPQKPGSTQGQTQPARHAPLAPGEVLDVNFPDEDANGHLTDQPQPQPPLNNDGNHPKLPY